MQFVSLTDGIVTGVIPAFFDSDRLTMVQMTFIGRMRSWNVIEGTYVTLGPGLRVAPSRRPDREQSCALASAKP